MNIRSLSKRLTELVERMALRDFENLLEELEKLLRRHECGKQHHAHHLQFSFNRCGIKVKGDHMTFQMLPTQSQVFAINPVKADESPSTATLSGQSYQSADSSVAAVTPDPSNPSQVSIAGQGKAGSVVVTATATATEPDGTTTEVVTGSITIILAVPPPAPAAALVFTPVGSPTP